MNNPKPILNGVSGSYILACIKSGKKHNFKCLSSTDGYFGCGKSGKKVKDCRWQSSKGKDGRKLNVLVLVQMLLIRTCLILFILPF